MINEKKSLSTLLSSAISLAMVIMWSHGHEAWEPGVWSPLSPHFPMPAIHWSPFPFLINWYRRWMILISMIRYWSKFPWRWVNSISVNVTLQQPSLSSLSAKPKILIHHFIPIPWKSKTPKYQIPQSLIPADNTQTSKSKWPITQSSIRVDNAQTCKTQVTDYVKSPKPSSRTI